MIKLSNILFLIFSLWISIGFSVSITNEDRILNIIPPTDITCVEVLSNGDVIINWTPSVLGAGTFDSYELFCLELGAVPIATFSNINTSNYTHIGANANAGALHYYVVTKSIFNSVLEMTFSDTLSTMFLNVNDTGQGTILIEWNPTHAPQNAGEDLIQDIFREYPTGVWTLRKQLPYGDFDFKDTIDVCSGTLNYKVEVNHSTGCKSISNIDGDYFVDILNPYIPEIINVSVNNTSGYVKVNWKENKAKDTYGYIIIRKINGFFEHIDTVYGKSNTTFDDYTSSFNTQSETYAIAAFDSCLINNTPPNYQTSASSELPHSTIYLEKSLDKCAKSVRLNWNKYEGWDDESGVLAYELFVGINGGTPIFYSSLLETKSSLTYPNLENDTTYCFYIKAISNSGLASFSNEICFIAIPLVNTNFHYLTMASYESNNTIDIELYTDGVEGVDYYELTKKGPTDFSFSIIESIEPIPFQNFYQFSDADIIPGRGVYEYQVNLIDTCGTVSEISNLANSIFLNIETDQIQMTNTLAWTEYLGFDGGIAKYEIYRGEDGVYDPTPTAIISSNLRTFVDDLSSEFVSEGDYCYKVKAIENINSYGFSRSIFSNERCFVFEPVVYIPNAFIRGGDSPTFLPVINLYDFSSFHLQVFSRRGNMIFESYKRNVGWDGTVYGYEYIHESVYIYRITFIDKEGKEYEFVGPFTLL